MKIAIGIHGTENVTTQVYFNHIGAISSWAKSFDLTLIGIAKMKVAAARNSIVRRAFEQGCTHWLSLDTDHCVRDDLLPLLVENASAAMVSGLVCKRGFPFDIVAFKIPSVLDTPLPIVLEPDTGVHVVDGCAMGCTLINLEKLRELPKPYFYDTPAKRSDLNLCYAFREKDESVLVDTRAWVGHETLPQVIWPKNLDKLRALYIAASDEIGKEEAS